MQGAVNRPSLRIMSPEHQSTVCVAGWNTDLSDPGPLRSPTFGSNSPTGNNENSMGYD